jgi:hypothetical protein
MGFRDLILLGGLAALASAADLPDYPVRPIGEYTHTESKSGLRVAVNPLGIYDQKKYFGREMSSDGFLPVLVILRNDSESDSFALRKQDVIYGAPFDGKPRVTQKKALLLAAVPVAGPVAELHLRARELERLESNMSIFKNELQSMTLQPGRESSGFLYISVPKIVPAKGSAQVQNAVFDLKLLRLGSDETVDFHFEL